MREPYRDDPVHPGRAAVGVRAALSRRARRRLSQAVRPSRPGSMHDAGDAHRPAPARWRRSAAAGVEILVAAPVHDVQAPEEIVDPPQGRAPRGHRAGIGGDVERAAPPRPRNRPARRAAAPRYSLSFAAIRVDPRRARVARMIGLGDPRRQRHRDRREPPRRWRDRRAAAAPSRRPTRATGRPSSSADLDRLARRAPRPPRAAPGRRRPRRAATGAGAAAAIACSLLTRSIGNDGEEQAADEPEQDLDRHQQRQPFVDLRPDAAARHRRLPCPAPA